MKRIIIIGTIIIYLILTSQSITSDQNVLDPPYETVGVFKLLFNSPTEPIVHDDGIVIVYGVHQLIPSIFERILPALWMSQYTIIEVEERPEWLSVSLPDSCPLTPPDGEEYTIMMCLAISEGAPMNASGTLELSIMTGKFMRTMFPYWFPFCNEYKMDQSMIIQTGEW